jgi:hypothetical protein
MNISPADAVSVISISTRISIQSCNRFDVSGQILIRRTVIALKALSIIFRSSQKPLSAQSMPRQVLVQAYDIYIPADTIFDSLIHRKRRDVSFGLDLLFFDTFVPVWHLLPLVNMWFEHCSLYIIYCKHFFILLYPQCIIKIADSNSC